MPRSDASPSRNANTPSTAPASPSPTRSSPCKAKDVANKRLHTRGTEMLTATGVATPNKPATEEKDDSLKAAKALTEL